MVTARSGHTDTLLPDGRVLVVGGQDIEAARVADVAPSPLASAELYDPNNGLWTATGSMGTARSGHTATLLPDGKVLVVGGGREETLEEGPAYSATAELYDPISQRWTATANMADPRVGHTATLLVDGRVLVAGVSIGPSPVTTAELYEPGSGIWTATGSMATARVDHTATRLADGRVLVASGHGPGSDPEPLDSAELYDPASERWTATGSMAEASFYHTATLLPDGTVFVADGFNADGLATAELYDPSSGRWTATASMVTARAGHTATLLADGRVLVAGGSDREAALIAGVEGSPQLSADLYDPSSRRWTATASMVTARAGHTATLLPDGRVLISGGSSLVFPAELYDPTGGS
jgi:N-acetylneuraminic acid mutarotase